MDDHGLLTLTQWLSPAFPLGSFSYSHGLEAAIADGDVTSAESLSAWLDYLLRFGTGRADATLLHAALRGEDPDALADVARALAASAERAQETEAQGAALARTVSAITDQDMPARPLPVALGVAARPLGMPAVQVVALYLHAFAGNLTSCATRFVPLGQTEAQAALAGLAPTILSVAAETEHTPVTDIASAAFGADLAAIAHETMDVRLFQT
ncbi:MAG: urease accessory UreF family protein [Pseudomonadota bacterium]